MGRPLPGIRPVDVPVPALRGDPAQFRFRVSIRISGGAGQHGEPRDTSLPALVIAVKKFHRPRLAAFDDLAGLLISGIVGVAEGALPESDIADRYVQIAVLPLELLERCVRGVAVPLGVKPTAVHHRDAVAHVAQAHGEVDRVVRPRRIVLTPTSPAAPPPGNSTHFLSPKLTFWVGSSRREAISTGRSPTSSDCWATLAVRFADLTAENVAIARISVPNAVARLATVAQLLQFTSDRVPGRGNTCRTDPRSRRVRPAAVAAGSRLRSSAGPGRYCAHQESRWSLPAAGRPTEGPIERGTRR